MSLVDIKNRQSVLSAITEFDQLGRAAFLKKYGFGGARSYFLRHNGANYDSKAIIGAAHGYEFGTPLLSDNFSGGEKTVQRKLQELGFEITVMEADFAALSSDDLVPGAILNNPELMARFDVGLMGGMRRSVERGHLVVVSDHTKTLYDDRWEGNLLHYTGMGKKGDQSLSSQNRTLAESPETRIKVYLFEVFDPGRYIFHGEVTLGGAPYQETQADEAGEPRLVWMFPLRLLTLDNQPTTTEDDIQRVRELRQRALRKLTIDQLRKRAQASSANPPRRASQSERIIRNEAVAAYVKKAAMGHCDLCGAKAPFIGRDKQPFLECHHVKHLANGGEDTIENAVALCPNCHRMMHALNISADRKKLRAHIENRESAINRSIKLT